MIDRVTHATDINDVWVQNFQCSESDIVGTCPIPHGCKNTSWTNVVVDGKSRNDFASYFLSG